MTVTVVLWKHQVRIDDLYTRLTTFLEQTHKKQYPLLYYTCHLLLPFWQYVLLLEFLRSPNLCSNKRRVVVVDQNSDLFLFCRRGETIQFWTSAASATCWGLERLQRWFISLQICFKLSRWSFIILQDINKLKSEIIYYPSLFVSLNISNYLHI